MTTLSLCLLKALAMQGPAEEVIPVLMPSQCSSSSSLLVLAQLTYRLSRALLLYISHRYSLVLTILPKQEFFMAW